MNSTSLVALIVVSAAIVVLALFLVMWHERTTKRTATVAVVSGIVLVAWMVSTCVLASSGFYLPPSSGPPPVGVQLLFALALLAVAVIASPSLRSLLTNQANLIRLNVWRLVGAVFLALMLTGQVPAIWALPAGLGDVLIGATAFWVAGRLEAPGGRKRAIIFNLLGLLDLIVAISLGMITSPGSTQLLQTTPSAGLLTQFPLVLVPTFLVPLAIANHLVSLKQLLGATWVVRRPTGALGTH